MKQHLLWPKILVCLAFVFMGLAFVQPVKAISYDSTLLLSSKDGSWAITDSMKATLNYNSDSPTFDFSITGAIGLTPDTSYSLIYYANPYPGNYPGAFIGSWSGLDIMDGDAVGSINLDMSMPTPPDANMVVVYNVPPNDITDKVHGAKIWLVLSSDYNNTTKSMVGWHQDKYLYETDLIVYTDTDLEIQGQGITASTTITEPQAIIGLNISLPNQETSLQFGSVNVGTCSNPPLVVTLTNTGNVPIKVTTTTSAGFYTDCLKINDLTANGWVSATIPVGSYLDINVKVCPTIAYSGTITGSVSFVASFAP